MSETLYELALRRLKEIADRSRDPLAGALAERYLRELQEPEKKGPDQ